MLSLLTLISQSKPLGDFQGLGGYQPEDLGGAGNLGDSGEKFADLASNIIGFLTIAAGIAFLIYFAIGGLTWITSGGDKGKVDEAKSRMTSGAIGMIVIVSTYAIVWIVSKVLGLDILDPNKVLTEYIKIPQ